jgi:radical SAM superfamily enzyme YgiQ (UPF0313 family)
LKILLVHPQLPGFLREKAGYYDRYCSMEPLGICYLAATLREAGFREVKLIDRGTSGFTDGELLKAILDEQPDLLGFSLNGTDMACALSLSVKIKQSLPDVHITLGGHHVTFIAEEILKIEPRIDSIVIGDGDDTICELAHALSRSEPLSSINGISFRDGDKVIKNRQRVSGRHLDELPHPARDILELRRELGLYPVARVLTSRGCPMRCTFCTTPGFDSLRVGASRQDRSAENVIAEIQFLVSEFGIRQILFCADSFISPDPHYRRELEELFHFIKGLGINFRIMDRASIILREQEKLLPLMLEAGLERILVGIESGSETVLRRFQKGSSVSTNRRAAELIREIGIPVQHGFIMFDPYVSFDELRENLQFLKDIGEHHAEAYLRSRYEVYPGAAMLAQLKTDGLLKANTGDVYEDCYCYNFQDPKIEAFYCELQEGFKQESALLDNVILNTDFTLYKIKRHLKMHPTRQDDLPALVKVLEGEQQILKKQVGDDNLEFFIGLMTWHEKRLQTAQKPSVERFKKRIKEHLQVAKEISEELEKLVP